MKRGEKGYWEWKAKVGRPKNLKSDKQLRELFTGYFQWADENKIMINEVIKSGEHAGTIIQVPTSRPYTWQGAETYMHDAGALAKLDDYRANTRGMYDQFSDTIAWATKVIHENKFTGAAVGIFKESIISKDLNLVERTETTVFEQPLFPEK